MLVDDVPSVQQSDTMPDDVPDDSTDDSGAGLTQEICDFVADLDLSAIPEDVIARGRIHMLDSMGLALAGGASPVCRILGHYAIRNAAKGAAAVYATGDRYAPAMAALDENFGRHLAFSPCKYPSGKFCRTATPSSSLTVALRGLKRSFRCKMNAGSKPMPGRALAVGHY